MVPKTSPLQMAALALSERKFDIFKHCYQSMRMIDDRVDDVFLMYDHGQRVSERDVFLAEINLWEQAIFSVFNDRFVRVGYADDFFSSFQQSLQRQFFLDSKPWGLLAEAMRFDVNEHLIKSENDFESYCDGACVAAAYIFLLILLAADEKNYLEIRRSIDLSYVWKIAQSMGTFCYLVHMLRDLEIDIKRGRSFFKLPECWWQASCSWGDLKRGVLENDVDTVDVFFRAMMPYARIYFEQMTHCHHDINPLLSSQEREALKILLTPYISLYQKWCLTF